MYRKRSSVRFFTNIGVLLLSLIVGVIAACSTGFFDSSSGCNKCPDHCKVCNSSDYCYICKNGFFGTTCQFSCNNCTPHTECTKDSGFCVDSCREGLSGQHCDRLCDIRCQSCDRKNTVNCLMCKNNQTCKLTCTCVNCPESYCSEGCLEGHWGDSCQHVCPANCTGGRCSRENGICSTDETTNLPTSMIILATVPVFLLITSGGIILVTYRLSRKLRPPEENKRHQNTDESEESYDEIGQLTENNQSSLQSPTHSANDHIRQATNPELYSVVKRTNDLEASTNHHQKVTLEPMCLERSMQEDGHMRSMNWRIV